MRERPILFNDAMVRAILDGSKWQTRRPVKLGAEAMAYVNSFRSPITRDSRVMSWCPFGAPGDLLWVRECFALGRVFDESRAAELPITERDVPVWFRADGGADESWSNRGKWRPSIHMPRWASRLTLRVADVRVERVQDITEEDARAEGVRKDDAAVVIDADGKIRSDLSHTYRGAFAAAWDSIYGKRDPSTPESWTANPWVWVVSFERVEVPHG